MEDSRLVVAASGGAMQLTENVSLFRLQVSDASEVVADLTGHEGLGMVPYEILPHLNRHDDTFLERVRRYSNSIPHSILALADGAAIVYVDGTPTISGRAAKFFLGAMEEIEQWPAI